MLPSSRKLNRLQRGILQKYAVACVYMISVVAAAYAIDWLDKSMFLDVVEQAHQQGSISEKVAKGFTILIESRSETSLSLPFVFAGVSDFFSCAGQQHYCGHGLLLFPKPLNSSRQCKI